MSWMLVTGFWKSLVAGRSIFVKPEVVVGLVDTAMLPPRSEMEVLLEPECGLEAGSWLLEPDMEGKVPVCVARAVVNTGGGRFPVRLLNPDSCPTMIRKGTKIATMEHVEERDLLA